MMFWIINLNPLKQLQGMVFLAPRQVKWKGHNLDQTLTEEEKLKGHAANMGFGKLVGMLYP